MFDPPEPVESAVKPPKVFICYAKEDAPAVRKLFKRLQAAGADPWFDMHNLRRGQRWRETIKATIRTADVFVPCLSPNFDKKGYKQVEVRLAMSVAEEEPIGREGFIIPFILEPCEIPTWCKELHVGDPSQPTPFEEFIQDIEAYTGTQLVPPDLNARRLKYLIAGLSSPNAEDRESAANALGRIGPAAADAVPALTAAQNDERHQVRSRAAIALGRIGPAAAAAVPALTETLKDEYDSVRGSAEEALKHIRCE